MSKDAAVRPLFMKGNEGDLVSREAVRPSPVAERDRSAPGGGRDEGARPPFFPLPPRAMRTTSPSQSEVPSPGADLLLGPSASFV